MLNKVIVYLIAICIIEPFLIARSQRVSRMAKNRRSGETNLLGLTQGGVSNVLFALILLGHKLVPDIVVILVSFLQT